MPPVRRITRRAPARIPRSRRGVVSVLAMMFLVLFGSLVAAMAIASQGNIRAASTHLHVMRASGAAETGLAIAMQRLNEACSRFVIAESDMDADTVWALWTGNTQFIEGEIIVRDPPSGYSEESPPAGIAEALALHHGADGNTLAYGGVLDPIIAPAPEDADLTVYKDDSWVYTPVVALEEITDQNGEPTSEPAFQITYAPLANGTDIRVIVTGYDFAYSRDGQPLKRIITHDFAITKRVSHAVIAPTRIMIGKNVHISGGLGVHYADVDVEYGDPLLLRTDFRYLDDALDAALDELYAGIKQYDVDHDNRLRVLHPIEQQGIPDGELFQDATKDGYVDEFDLFINRFDTNQDGKVALSDELRAGTPNEALSAEFYGDGVPIDEDLAKLIDWGRPDRNENGIYGFDDVNMDGQWDPASEPLLDYDPVYDVFADQELGWRDGVIDRLDQYVKLNGSIAFAVDQGDWEANQGAWQDRLWGAIEPDEGFTPMLFNADGDDLPDVVQADDFIDAGNDLKAAADGDDFWQQVADELGIPLDDLETYVETKPDGTNLPRYFRVDPDTDGDGLPDNWAEAYFEKMPFNSPQFSDWYYRPVFENMIFRDCEIPTGLNALFINCTFVGVTWIRTYTDDTHPYWTIYGKMAFDTSIEAPREETERWVYGDDPGEQGDHPPMLPNSAVPPNQLLFMATEPIDKGDVLNSEIGSFNPDDYDSLPDPLVIDGLRVTDTKRYSNNIRFHDCLVVGSIVTDAPVQYHHVRNKLQFTGKTRFEVRHPEAPDDPLLNPEPQDEDLIAKSSLLAPNYSVDIGTFNSPPEQNVHLRGVIVAGLLDVRGNATIEGALLMTFTPVLGEPPLSDPLGNPVGNPAHFNTTLGYFGPDDGDNESLDPQDLPIIDGVRIVGWDTDGDGLADVGPDEDPPPDAEPVPFWGYGRIELRFDPVMAMPDGILMPLRAEGRSGSYREGVH